MCGICGFVGGGTPDDLQRMMAAIAHRGPDAAGSWSDPAQRVHFGHQRLSIVDLCTGDQPMRTADGDLTIVFNGEIYNHAKLRAELTALGHRFITDHSDTEVLLHGYRAWGLDLTSRLNGMWAFVLHDAARRRLFASRDRFGKKPFFYSTLNGGFVFGSELEAIRAHREIGPRLALSRLALKKYFGYGYIPAPHTVWTGVAKLPAGHSLLLDLAEPAHPKLRRHWSFVMEPEPITSKRSADARAEELRVALQRAVQRRLVADVPVGVFLSGGVDSSAVTALASASRPAAGVNTYCIGFEEPSFDESAFARQVAAHCGTSHHEERLSIEKARVLLPEIVGRLDEPMADSSLLPTALLCRFARQHVKVALGGDGGDELFAGYDPFRALAAARRYQQWVPRPVHQAIALVAHRLPVSHRNMSLDFKAKRFLRGVNRREALWLPTWMAPLTAVELESIFDETIDPEDLYSEAIAAWESCAQPDPVDRTIQFYVQLYLQDDILVKVDRASMQVGLEARAPFLDLEVVDVARRIPWQWKYRRGQTKYLLKRALEPLLPHAIIHRKKKGFGMPIGAWLKQGRLPLERPALAPEFTRSALAQHRSGRVDHRAFLWAMWLLTEWQTSRPPLS
ncbi:asparagine synthase (glutamine-hydrolyzing) [Opitutaceae bacterium EW11]|nr:asparagine synthase (glutamine-hydrolyzing) [Opitutaceae bacterium EW11]